MRDLDSPFHEGERAIQERLGMRERIESIGHRVIRDHMPAQHRELFEKLPLLLLGTLGHDGQPWASVVHGSPGFVRSPDSRSLHVAALPERDDPAFEALRAGAKVGLLGIELETRRRNRANGRIAERSELGFAVSVEQSFGNCPKYIHLREHRPVERTGRQTQQEGPSLSAGARALIARADTCFIASASRHANLSSEPREGVDVSHRGGPPGFVALRDNEETVRLTMPDYVGNNLFNTLGNLVRNPLAGLLFVDFRRGDLLSLRCAAEIDWSGDALASFPGAQRLLHLTVRGGVFFRAALPFSWSDADRPD
jgi:uncharacterized protein